MDTNARRRTTVHDVAALRIHRDGTRVANSDTNRRSRRAKYTVRDARGNWIAKDAGGLGTVTSRPGASKEDDGQDEDASEVEADELLQDELRPSQRKDKGKGRAIDDEGDIAVNTRAGKRRRFDEDFSFLNPGAEPALLPSQTGEPLHPHPEGRAFKTIPVPSSDLLKCLHYFASAYYTAMGQLYDAGRESRKERKMRRAQRLKATAIASSSRPRSEPKSAEYSEDSSAAEDIEFTEDEQDIEEPAEEDGGDDRTDGEGKEGVERGNPKNKRPKTRRPMEKDMYKLFDGSARTLCKECYCKSTLPSHSNRTFLRAGRGKWHWWRESASWKRRGLGRHRICARGVAQPRLKLQDCQICSLRTRTGKQRHYWRKTRARQRRSKTETMRRVASQSNESSGE